MQPSGAKAASDRRGGAKALVTMALLAATAGPALAGDRALIDYLGFSDDFRYFAFEEFGVQDGSGFAYSNIYIVDLSTDSWVVGTPIRVQADSEEKRLFNVRAEAANIAFDFVEDYGLTVPVEIAALIGDGVPDPDAKSLEFGAPAYNAGTVSGDYRLELEAFVTTATSPCAEWFGFDAKGYQLSISDGGNERLIHRDAAGLPRSRGCPMDYRIHSVVMPFMAPTLSHAVAIISVYPGGFEGPDRRFLAVPLGL
jgi:predicted secreted protein